MDESDIESIDKSEASIRGHWLTDRRVFFNSSRSWMTDMWLRDVGAIACFGGFVRVLRTVMGLK